MRAPIDLLLAKSSLFLERIVPLSSFPDLSVCLFHIHKHTFSLCLNSYFKFGNSILNYNAMHKLFTFQYSFHMPHHCPKQVCFPWCLDHPKYLDSSRHLSQVVAFVSACWKLKLLQLRSNIFRSPSRRDSGKEIFSHFLYDSQLSGAFFP